VAPLTRSLYSAASFIDDGKKISIEVVHVGFRIKVEHYGLQEFSTKHFYVLKITNFISMAIFLVMSEKHTN
jgi:hypothetical protein